MYIATVRNMPATGYSNPRRHGPTTSRIVFITSVKTRFYVLVPKVLLLISYASWGYVGILAAISQWYASTPLLIRVPGTLLFVSIVYMILCKVISLVKGKGHYHSRILGIAAAVLALSIIGLIAGALLSLKRNPYHIEVTRLKEPINVFGVYRFIPMRTAYTNAISMLQIPTHTLYFEDSYVYFANGTLVYNWIIEPEGFWNEVTKGPRGVVFVDAGAYPPKVTIIYRNMTWGLHNIKLTPGYVDGLYREAQLVAGLGKKLVLEDNVEVIWNGKVYILVPAITWVTGLDYSLPIPAGYIVVDENGHMEWLSIDKARNDPRFKGVPLLPEVVARQWV